MTNEHDVRLLSYIRQSIDLVRERTGSGRSAFLADLDLQDAVLWRLETLADAAHRLPDDLHERHPGVRWRAIYGFRNIAAHAYLDLLLERVWEIIEMHLPILSEAVDQELRSSEPDGAA